MREHLGKVLGIAVVLAMSAEVVPSRAAAAETSVAVHVVGIDQKKGEIYAGLYNAGGWKDGHFVNAVHVPVTGSDVTLSMDAPAPGRYAIRLFQDLNGNDKLDKNFFGVPQEPYAFSNNAAGSMGLPDFDAAAFDVSAGGAKQEIRLQ